MMPSRNGKGEFMKKKHISVSLILLLILMIVIFCFSAQPAEESTITSSRVCRFIAERVFSNFASYDEIFQKKIISGMTHVVRKTAHFTEYTLMGFLWYLLLRKKKLNILLSVSGTAFYAASDELHQKFVAGRSGQLSDVLLDTCGGCFGVFLAFVLVCVIYCCMDKETMRWGVWKK